MDKDFNKVIADYLRWKNNSTEENDEQVITEFGGDKENTILAVYPDDKYLYYQDSERGIELYTIIDEKDYSKSIEGSATTI